MLRPPRKSVVLLTCLGLLALGATMNAAASTTATFSGPAYSSAACTPVPGGIGPQQWNAAVGLPLNPSGTPLAQRLVIGELSETASQVAVSNLLRQCGLTDVTLLTETRPWGAAPNPGSESTLDATVIAAALPANATITMVNSASNAGFYGMLVTAAYACGFNFVGDPTLALSPITKSGTYPAGGCIISVSYGGAEPGSTDANLVASNFMMDQFAAQGVIVVVSAGDEGSGGCISSGGNPFSNAVPVSVTKVAITNNVATLATSAAHGFNVGQQVYLAGISEPFQGVFRISATPTTTTFSFGLPNSDIPDSTLPTPGAAFVNFGNLDPQFLATNPQALAVGGTQWDSQVTSMASGLRPVYAAGATYQNFVWKDSNPNPNCANLGTFPFSGGEGTGGGQSAVYTMPNYQSSAALASYPGATNFRMIPDVAALAGWPMYAIANWGMSVSAKQLIDTQAMLVTSQSSGLAVGESMTVAGVGAPFDGTFTVTGTPYTNAFTYTTSRISITNAAISSNVATVTTSAPHGLVPGQVVAVVGATSAFNGSFVVASTPATTTFTYALTGANVSAPSAGRVDVKADWSVPTGSVAAGCTGGATPPCAAYAFPWVPVVGTSAAAPLIAVGIANVNAVLSARGMAPLDNAGGAMDVHTTFYSAANASALSDVVDGNSDILGLGGWNALPGYDMVSGMGVPNFTTLANLIIARNTPAPPVPAATTASATPAPTPSAVATQTPLPTPIPITPSIRVPIAIAVGVQVPGGSAIIDVRVAQVNPVGLSVANAPTAAVSLGRWTRFSVSKQPAKAVVTASVLVKGSWHRIGSAQANRAGQVKLPAVRFLKAGSYPVRFTAPGAKPAYVNVNVKATPHSTRSNRYATTEGQGRT